ncbi:PLP-dependent aminotransferase family protein [Bacillaceae bacterium Marseille-Q3522]|nr:PLP-dependent aminotransferase family protein [Bacillaceae bacterium Marseille-Q3522]
MSALQEFTFSKRFPNIPFVKPAKRGEQINFTPLSFGFPPKEAFPIDELADAAVIALKTEGKDCLQYSGGPGMEQLVEWIKQRSALRSIGAENNQILVTTGSMQAIDLATRTLTDPGDQVWIESPSFFGAIRIFSLAEVELTSFAVDENGLRVDLVEQALLEARANGKPLPKMMYIMPNYHNPTGVNLSLERRKKLAMLAYEYNFYILEDDAYVELNFQGDYLPSIYSFAPERVVYLSTFSKIIAPGIRMGWAISGEEVISKMAMLKADGRTSVFVQEVAAKYLTSIDFEAHLAKLNALYLTRKNAMVQSIREFFGDEVSFVAPEGGFFLWLTFPQGVDTSLFYDQSVKNGVTYIDGANFYLGEKELNHIRLCFTFCNEEEIRTGIKRIADSYFSYKNSVQKVVKGRG